MLRFNEVSTPLTKKTNDMNEEMKKQVEMLIDFLIELHDNGLINNHDFNYEKEALYFIYKRYEKTN